MSRFKILGTLLVSALLIAAPANAQTEAPTEVFEAELHLTNGMVLKGTVVHQDLSSAHLLLEGGSDEPMIVPMAMIVRIDHVYVGPAAEEEAAVVTPAERATPTAPAPRRTAAETGRAVGFGMNTAWGLGWGSTTNTPLLGEQHDGPHMDIEPPGLELRLFPSDAFSIDVLIRIGSLLLRAALEQPNEWGYEEGPIPALNIYFHFWGEPRWAGGVWLTPSIGPGIALGGRYAIGPLLFPPHTGITMRLGLEISSADRGFGWGVHVRPGIGMGGPVVALIDSDDLAAGAEVLLEFSWHLYSPRP